MDGMNVVILVSIALPILWAIGSAVSTANVQKKFAALGQLKGLTKGEILQAVGPPNSASVAGEGKELLQWQVTGYHIALLFTDGICDGVTHEHSVA